MKRVAFILVLLTSFGAAQACFASESVNPREILKKIGIDQKPGAQVPLDTVFKDEAGREVKLGDYFGKRPVLLAPVYFKCPMLCSLVLNGAVIALRAVPFTVGKEFDVIAMSFDPNDRVEMAAAKKDTLVKEYGRAGSGDGWHFLTGEPAAIQAVTDSIGFRFEYDAEQGEFAHAGTVIVLTPEGKVNRYFIGIEYSAKELKYALMQASKNKIGSIADQILLFCYHYNPLSGKYGSAIALGLRISGIGMVLAMGIYIFRALRQERRSRTPEASKGAPR